MNCDSYLPSIKKLLDNLSQILNVHYEIRDHDGRVINGLDNDKDSYREFYEKFFKMIVSSGKPRMKKNPNGEKIFGLPLIANAESIGSYVVIHACSPVATSTNRRKSKIHDETVKHNFDGSIIRFVQDQLDHLLLQYAQEKELEDFAAELSLRYEELNFIYEVGGRIGQVEDFDEALHYLLQKAMELVDGDLVFTHIPSKHIMDSITVGQKSCFVGFSGNQLLAKITPPVLKIFQNGCDYLSSKDLQHISNIKAYIESYDDLLILPVKLKGRAEGILLFGKQNKNKVFAISDKKLIAVVSEIISIKVTNAELFRDLKEFLINVMKSFVKAIEEKDEYTRGHSERVNTFSLKIGSHLGLTHKEMESLNYASILHDIGKMGIAEEILTKPDTLTEEEFAKVKQHPLKGYEILKPMKQLEGALPAILYHHERIDGKGYPAGLKGDEIPLLARIIAVADVYDAITSIRAYRTMSKEYAIKEMIQVGGKQLDAEITRIFIKECLGVNLNKSQRKKCRF